MHKPHRFISILIIFLGFTFSQVKASHEHYISYVPGGLIVKGKELSISDPLMNTGSFSYNVSRSDIIVRLKYEDTESNFIDQYVEWTVDYDIELYYINSSGQSDTVFYTGDIDGTYRTIEWTRNLIHLYEPIEQNNTQNETFIPFR